MTPAPALPGTALIVLTGLPGSGKTTRACAWRDQAPNRARVNRDDLRRSMFGYDGVGEPWQENAVTVAQHAAVKALLIAGYDVAVDDTNLRPGFVEALRFVAAQARADVEVWDMTDVPVETCIAQDAARGCDGGRFVGPHVIRQMAAQLQADRQREETSGG